MAGKQNLYYINILNPFFKSKQNILCCCVKNLKIYMMLGSLEIDNNYIVPVINIRWEKIGLFCYKKLEINSYWVNFELSLKPGSYSPSDYQHLGILLQQ